MTVVPWRLKALLARRFPLAYHLALGIGSKPNAPGSWDALLQAEWDDRGRQWPTKNKLIESLTERSDRILDVGCGTGGILRHLNGQGYSDLWGLEQSDYAIKRLRSEGINMIRARLPSIPADDGSCDVTIASQVLEHIIRRKQFLKEIRRVLRPGGRALIFVPDDCLSPLDEPSHVHVYTRRSLGRFLEPYFDSVTVKSMKDENFSMPILFADATR